MTTTRERVTVLLEIALEDLRKSIGAGGAEAATARRRSDKIGCGATAILEKGRVRATLAELEEAGEAATRGPSTTKTTSAEGCCKGKSQTRHESPPSAEPEYESVVDFRAAGKTGGLLIGVGHEAR